MSIMWNISTTFQKKKKRKKKLTLSKYRHELVGSPVCSPNISMAGPEFYT